jgi:uncharacterized membrane protein
VNVEVIDPASRDNGLKNVGHVSYLLHTIVAVGAVLPGAQASVVLLLVALVIDLVKRGDAAGTWHASHFSWRLRSLVWAGVLYLLTAPLWVLLIAPGWIAWTLISIWFLYRIVRGWASLNKNASMPT